MPTNNRLFSRGNLLRNEMNVKYTDIPLLKLSAAIKRSKNLYFVMHAQPESGESRDTHSVGLVLAMPYNESSNFWASSFSLNGLLDFKTRAKIS